MTPAEAKAALDAQLAAHGETITVIRGADSVSCRAQVRGVKADEIEGMIMQTDLRVIVSATAFSTFGLIKANDKTVIKGKERQVKFSDPIYIDGTWVRCNLLVAG